MAPSNPNYPAYIGALSSLECHITGSNRFPNGSGLGIPGASSRLVLTRRLAVKMCQLAVK